MVWWHFYLLVIFFSIPSYGFAPALPSASYESEWNPSLPTSLQQEWEEKSQKLNHHRSALSSEALSAYTFLIIPGQWGDFSQYLKGYSGNYFRNLETVIERHGGTVTWAQTRSLNSVEQNVQIIVQALRDLHSRTQKRVIAIGHSRGGAELFLAVLRNPDLIPGIKRLILQQAPILGTDMADPQKIRIPSVLVSPFADGLSELVPEKLTEKLDLALDALNDAQKQSISKRTFFLASRMPSHLGWRDTFIDLFLSVISQADLTTIPSDGVVKTQAQFYSPFCASHNVRLVEARHEDLLIHLPGSRVTPTQREAFAYLLLEACGVLPTPQKSE